MSLQSRLGAFISQVGADVKALETQIANVSAGSYPWIEEHVFATLSIPSTNPVDLFAGFAPAADTIYVVESQLLTQTNATTTGLRPELAGPTTGILRSGVKFQSPSGSGTIKNDHFVLNEYSQGTASVAGPGIVTMVSIIETGPTPGSGNIRVRMRSEVAATNAILVYPGSFMRWRTL